MVFKNVTKQSLVGVRGANDASRVRVQLSSSRAYSNRARLDSLTFRVELELEFEF